MVSLIKFTGVSRFEEKQIVVTLCIVSQNIHNVERKKRNVSLWHQKTKIKRV